MSFLRFHLTGTWLRPLILGLSLGALALLPGFAQIGGGGLGGGRRSGGGRAGFGRGGDDGGADGRYGVPVWNVDEEFRDDVFVFARLMYGSNGAGRSIDNWATDFPQADLNLAFRLQQMTTLKVHPHQRPVPIEERELANFPFVYMLEVRGLQLREDEAAALRKYLLNGGFLMVDDFWGQAAWDNLVRQMALVFPDRPIVDLPLEHPIFHGVFDLKQYPQMPAIGVFERYGITWEPGHGYGPDDDTGPHYRAILDDKGRIMVILCHNTDLGDGWEREGLSVEYFKKFSEPLAYPMAINILFYAMTH